MKRAGELTAGKDEGRLSSFTATVSTPTSVLCHGCLEPYPHPLPILCRGGCRTFRYCSDSCRENDWTIGMHSTKCRFVQRYCDSCGDVEEYNRLSFDSCYEESERRAEESSGQNPRRRRLWGRVQIACDDVPFHEYTCSSVCRRSEALVTQAKPTGRDITCRVGDQGTVFLLPHQIDAGGSLLILLDDDEDEGGKNNKEKLILCDVFALEPLSVRNNNKMDTTTLERESERLWLEGSYHWFRGELLTAMKCFQESVDCFQWRVSGENKAKNDNGKEEELLCVSCGKKFDPHHFSGPPLRREKMRNAILRRCYFLGMCLNDYNEPIQARMYFTRALRTKILSTPAPHSLLTELMLSFEENGDVEGARKVAQWSIDMEQGMSCSQRWRNKYQRPGFVSGNVDSSSPSFYPPDNPLYPIWCHDLARHYDIIKEEFMALTNLRCSVASMDSVDYGPPQHWPQVGGSHRESGRDDYRVVSRGDWREMVLFGSGGENISGRNSFAPKTRNILRRCAPDAVSLCYAGGGEIIFSVLAPHTHIAPHCASTNIRLTAHLALVVPRRPSPLHRGCAIRVAQDWHEWTEGSMIVFDDSYEHEVTNDTDECRAVLLMRFWHPSIPKDKRMDTLQNIFRQKEMARKVRFVPPLPDRFVEVEKRALGKSVCLKCAKTEQVHTQRGRCGNVEFMCPCGMIIQEEQSGLK